MWVGCMKICTGTKHLRPLKNPEIDQSMRPIAIVCHEADDSDKKSRVCKVYCTCHCVSLPATACRWLRRPLRIVPRSFILWMPKGALLEILHYPAQPKGWFCWPVGWVFPIFAPQPAAANPGHHVVIYCTHVPCGSPSGDLSEPEHEGPFEADAGFQRSYI